MPILTFNKQLPRLNTAVVAARVHYKFKGGAKQEFSGMAFVTYASVELARRAVQMFNNMTTQKGGYVQAEQSDLMIVRPRHPSNNAGAPRFNQRVWDFPLEV